MYKRDLGTEVGVLNSQAVPISQVVLRAGFTVSRAIRTKDSSETETYPRILSATDWNDPCIEHSEE